MLSFRYLFLQHGYSFLFAYSLGTSIGLPLPADPLFLLMGAMVGNNRYYFVPALLAAVLATLIGDLLWYELGRFKGRSILGLLCKISLEPDVCVRKAEGAFAKRGAGALIFAKFIPGMSLVSVSLAGVTKIGYWRFLLADTAGCVLWTGSYILLGRIFYRQVDSLISLLGLFGRRAGLVILILLALYTSWKYLQRRRFIRTLRVNRVHAKEVVALRDKGEPITIIDLRHPAEIEREGMKIAGAIVARPDDLRSLSHEIPENQQIILYCT